MEGQHIKLFSGAVIVAITAALLLPLAQQQLAIYQLRHALPGLVSSPAKGPRPWHVTVDRVDHEQPFTKVMVSVLNKSQAETIRTAFIECTELDLSRKPIAQANSLVSDVPAGETRYDEILIMMPSSPVAHGTVECRGSGSVWR